MQKQPHSISSSEEEEGPDSSISSLVKMTICKRLPNNLIPLLG